MAKGKRTPALLYPLIIDFEIDASTVYLLIKNIGNTALLNLKIKPSTAIFGLEGTKNLSELNIFKEIKYLAPLKEIKIFIDGYDSFFHHLKKTLIEFHITYQDEYKTIFKTKISHDLNIYTDLILPIKK